MKLRIGLIGVLALVTALLIANCGKSTAPEKPLADRVYMPTDLKVTAGDHFTVPIYFENREVITALSLPLAFNSSSVRCDSVSFIGSRVLKFLFRPVAVRNDSLQIKIAAIDTLGVAPGRGLLATLHFWAYGNAPETDMTIDTTFLYPPTPLVFADSSLEIITSTPEFVPGKVHIRTQL